LKLRKILGITLASLTLLALSFGLGFRKTITLTIDGQSRTLNTYALTVGGLLRLEGVALGDQDAVEPTLTSWLKNHHTINITHAIPVQIWADSRMVSFTSPARQPAALLAQAGLVVNPDDQLFSNGSSYSVAQPFPADLHAISMQIMRSVTFSLSDGSSTLTYTSSADTLGDALWEAGVNYLEADQLDPVASTLLTPGLQARLLHSRPVTIQTINLDISLYTAEQTVGGALVDAGLALQGLDYSLPAPDNPIPAEGEIRLVRVREEVILEQTPVPFDTLTQPVSDLEIDNQSIIQPGEYGLTTRRIRVRYEDGVEIARIVETEWTSRQPQPRIVGYGSQLVMHTTVVDGVTIQYWRAITMWATSYHPSEVGNTTASGLPLQFGVAAVDIHYVPFFTRLYVPGYGEVIAADTGGGVIGRWIDLGYSDDDYVPWHSYVVVYFLWPPPDDIVWIYP
jgi:uncharacterized protein YabE (DUF348 family)